MNETKTDSGADALKKNFEELLGLSVEALMKRAFDESWKIREVEFWLKVKNEQNFERIAEFLEDLKVRIENIDEDTKNINASLATLLERT